MNQVKTILESLKDLKVNEIDPLIDKLIRTGLFIERHIPNTNSNNILFIFPNGRMLATKEEWVTHHDLFVVLHDKLVDELPHPITNSNLGKYYNIIFPIVTFNSDSEDVTFYKPDTVDITPEQQHRIDQFSKKFRRVTIQETKQGVPLPLLENLNINKISEDLINHYGSSSLEDGGFILPNGEVLNMDRSLSLWIDDDGNLVWDQLNTEITTHDDVVDYLNEIGYEVYSTTDLIEEGIIRQLGLGGIEFIVEPTKEQYKTITELKNKTRKHNSILSVEINGNKGRLYIESQPYMPTSELIQQIKNYFNTQ